jgi:hypothetical protein
MRKQALSNMGPLMGNPMQTLESHDTGSLVNCRASPGGREDVMPKKPSLMENVSREVIPHLNSAGSTLSHSETCETRDTVWASKSVQNSELSSCQGAIYTDTCNSSLGPDEFLVFHGLAINKFYCILFYFIYLFFFFCGNLQRSFQILMG